VPGPEQRRPMEKDKSYLVYVKLDNQGRLIASSKLDYFLDKLPVPYKPGEQVSLLIAENTPLGKKVIINDCHWGLIHRSDLLPTLGYGQKIYGFIKTVRADAKIDIVLRKPGATNIRLLAEQILTELNQRSGFMPLHDKSSSADIHRTFAASKTSFKSAIGYLYKLGEITIAADGIRLQKKNTL
jgi:predicted RNA-binding protein (virulence factor B family)